MEDTDFKVKEWLSRRRSSVIERKQFEKSIIQNKPILWVMGPAGVGKGTQCAKLQARYGYTHLSSGELMRYEILEGSDRSQLLLELMKSGKPVPNETVIDIIAQAIVALAKGSNGFVIDGFPLDEEQASAFEKEFGSPSLVFHLVCNGGILRERLQERNNYDDTKDAVGNRMKMFSEFTKPVLAKYDAIKINTDKTKDEVFHEIESAMIRKLGIAKSLLAD